MFDEFAEYHARVLIWAVAFVWLWFILVIMELDDDNEDHKD